MKYIFKIYFLFLFSLVFIGCEKDKKTVLSGDIIGVVNLRDDCYYELEDKSGVDVKLTGEEIALQSVTDVNGYYSFENLPYGYYHIDFLKDSYYEEKDNYNFHHVGGKAPTLIDQTMNEIPNYDVTIDSLKYFEDELYMWIQFFITINGNYKKINTSQRYFHCFFSNSPDVSCANYENNINWYFESINTENSAFMGDWTWYLAEHNFLYQYPDTIYLCIYPQAYFQGMLPKDFHYEVPPPVKPESLGKPSNVVAFTLEEIHQLL